MRLSFGIFEWADDVLKPDGRPTVTANGFREKLSAQSAPLGLETSKILNAHTHNDGLQGEGEGAERAVRDP